MKKYRCNRFMFRVWLSIVLVLCWGGLFLFSVQSGAQNLKSQIILDITQLPETKQERVEGLDQTIQDYIDNSQWTDDPLGFDVALTFTMSLQDISQSHEDRYAVQLQASNTRDIQHMDRYCRFPYQMNDPLFRDDNTYEPLTGLIDFYIYMILGGEMDKRALLGGTQFYEKALNVCENASFGRSEFYKGWDIRKELVDNVLSKEMEIVRKLQAIFFRAKVYHQEGNSAKARRYCRAVVVELGKMHDTNPEDERVKEFFKYHYFEFGELFEDAKDPELFKRLIELDPEHKEEYEKYTS